ncbi:unnamed protein product [[Candida] boidinii]|nr:unnamed protein product [[Candida] boidinii]
MKNQTNTIEMLLEMIMMLQKSATEHFSDSEDEAEETDEVDEPSGSEDEEEMQVYSDLDDEEEEEEEQEGGKEEGEGGKEEGEEKKLEIGTGTALLAAKKAEIIEKVIELMTQVEENKVKVTSQEFKEKMELYSNYVNISEFYQFSPLHKDELSAQEVEEEKVEVKQQSKSISNPFQFIKNKVFETTNFKSTTQKNTNSNLLNSNDSRISKEPTISNSNKTSTTNKVFGISINSMWGNISTKYN